MTSFLGRLGALTGLVIAALGFGCTAADGAAPDDDVEDADAAQTVNGRQTVYGASTSSCSTLAVRGLSEQLVQEMMCLSPQLLAQLNPSDNVELAPEVFPYLQTSAARALERGLATYGKKVTINSALRTLPQQYLLRRWDARNRCGVRIAAAVGESNHEPGLAVDIKLLTTTENRKLRTALDGVGFKWIGAFDPVHFDYKGDGATEDVGRLSVLAFKRLWNRNTANARDQLPVDDTYDAKVETKLKNAPAAGFEIGADCSDVPPH